MNLYKNIKNREIPSLLRAAYEVNNENMEEAAADIDTIDTALGGAEEPLSNQCAFSQSKGKPMEHKQKFQGNHGKHSFGKEGSQTMNGIEFFVKITLFKGSHADAVVYYRRYMNIDFILRWKWYFEYLAARLKVSHPREKVELLCGRIDLFDIAINKKREKIERIENEIHRLENGEQIFWVYEDYINEIHKYINK